MGRGDPLSVIRVLINIGEIGFGILFLVSAIFNLSYTLRHGREFYGSFAANAWFEPYKLLIRNIVIPHTTPFTILLIILLASLALMILTRGSLVKPALIAGAVFTLAAVLASNLPGAIANLAMAAPTEVPMYIKLNR